MSNKHRNIIRKIIELKYMSHDAGLPVTAAHLTRAMAPVEAETNHGISSYVSNRVFSGVRAISPARTKKLQARR